MISYAAIVIFISVLACSEDKQDGGRTSANPVPSETPSVSASAEPSAGTSATHAYGGSIYGQLSVDSNVPGSAKAHAKIAVEGHPEVTGETDGEGAFTVQDVPPGSINVLVLSQDNSLLSQSSAYGVKIAEVLVKSGATTDVGTPVMKKTGAVSGSVKFYDNPNGLDLTGSDVYIPGTSFIAKSDATGAFTLAGIPEGSYLLRFDHTGFSSVELEVNIVSDQTLSLGDVLLSIARGPEGSITVSTDTQISINGAAVKIAKARGVSISLRFDSDTALMKIADEPSFLNRPWVPAANSYSWTFTSDGYKSLYVKYSDLNGLESSPYSDSIYVDTVAPVLNGISLLNGWAQSAKKEIIVDIAASDSSSGVSEIMFSNTSSAFSAGETWQPYSPRMNWTLTPAAGAHTVYAKVRDYAGRESQVLSDDINTGTYTLIFAQTYTSSIKLYKAQSPYLVSADVIFQSDLEIEPGVVIYLDGVSITAKAKVTARGSATERIAIAALTPPTNCTFMASSGFFYNNQGLVGATAGSTFEYVDFVSLRTIGLSGGKVTNSKFDASACSSGTIGSLEKTGFDNLTMTDNTFVKFKTPIKVSDGNGNTTFANNSGTAGDFFIQNANASNTTVHDNIFTLLGQGTAYTLNGPAALSNNTLSGTVGTGISINATPGDTSNSISWNVTGTGNSMPTVTGTLISAGSGSGTYTITNPGANGVTDNFGYIINSSLNENSSLTVSGLNISSCYGLAYMNTPRALTIQNSTISGCKIGVIFMGGNGAGGSFTMSHSNITVADALLSSSTSSPTVNLNYNNITCSNGSGSYCDLFYRVYGAGVTDSISISNSNIYCPTATCRGFVDEANSAQTRSLVLTFTGNYWSDKAPDGNFVSTPIQASSSSITTTSNARLAHFKFTLDNMALLTFSDSLTNTTVASPVAGAGP